MEDGELTLVKRRGELRMRGARRSRRRTAGDMGETVADGGWVVEASRGRG